MRVLVTGSDGYIGSVLGPYLGERGFDVVGVDTGFYRGTPLYDAATARIETFARDIRHLRESDLAGFDAVVHMAELSNDPVGQLAPTITYDINHRGSVRLALAARAGGVERFVYTSSCSVYGRSDDELVDEDSPLDPQTAYAVCKRLVERDVSALASDGFSPTFLRNATAYGASPRMRFDIVVNNLCGLAWTTQEVRVESDGTPWRPLVHVLDISRAIADVLEAPREVVHGVVLNVGDRDANYQIREIAEIVARVFPDCDVTIGGRSPDERSYRVSFARIHELLPGFACDWTVERGARELRDIFAAVGLTSDEFLSRDFTRLKQIEHLLAAREIDESFYWTTKGHEVTPAADRA
jgi:nucleoside-diphosphate-sugar epimerase